MTETTLDTSLVKVLNLHMTTYYFFVSFALLTVPTKAMALYREAVSTTPIFFFWRGGLPAFYLMVFFFTFCIISSSLALSRFNVGRIWMDGVQVQVNL